MGCTTRSTRGVSSGRDHESGGQGGSRDTLIPYSRLRQRLDRRARLSRGRRNGCLEARPGDIAREIYQEQVPYCLEQVLGKHSEARGVKEKALTNTKTLSPANPGGDINFLH